MPQVTVYVRDEDLDKWKAIEKKSQWLHDALSGSAGSRSSLSPQQTQVKRNPASAVSQTLQPRPLSELLAEELEEDKYPGIMIHRLTGQVVDTINEEQADGVTKEMVDYLKKNNRYV